MYRKYLISTESSRLINQLSGDDCQHPLHAIPGACMRTDTMGHPREIKLFYIFDDIRGNNILFVTSDDSVYALGSNRWGQLGLGHNAPIEAPVLIPELCRQNIRQFVNGLDFVVALDKDNKKIFWLAGNQWGDLEQSDIYFKPRLITINESIETIFEQICCGENHTLVLTTNGQVYGWGSNKCGQIGCGSRDMDTISTPINIEFPIGYKILNIICYELISSAVTPDGQVFVWGAINDIKIYSPKLLENIWNVIKVFVWGAINDIKIYSPKLLEN
ncbi:unnamed protein product, partial [Oppiella nova]